MFHGTFGLVVVVEDLAYGLAGLGLVVICLADRTVEVCTRRRTATRRLGCAARASSPATTAVSRGAPAVAPSAVTIRHLAPRIMMTRTLSLVVAQNILVAGASSAGIPRVLTNRASLVISGAQGIGVGLCGCVALLILSVPDCVQGDRAQACLAADGLCARFSGVVRIEEVGDKSIERGVSAVEDVVVLVSVGVVDEILERGLQVLRKRREEWKHGLKTKSEFWKRQRALLQSQEVLRSRVELLVDLIDHLLAHLIVKQREILSLRTKKGAEAAS